jgi:hypothetical protein
MEVGEENNKEKSEEKEDIIKELWKRIRHLESEKNHRFVDLRHSASLVIFVGSFGQEKAMTAKFYMVIWFL